MLLLCLAAAPANAGAPGPGCVLDTTTPAHSHKLGAVRSTDVPPLVLQAPVEMDPADFDYIADVLADALPVMMELLGAPYGLDTLTVALFPDNPGFARYTRSFKRIDMFPIPAARNHDDDGDGQIDEDPFDRVDNDGDGRVDEDLAYAPSWDNVFFHELTHAFQTDLLTSMPGWFDEGFAEAVRYFAGEKLASAPQPREGRFKRFDQRMAGFDMLDHESAQMFGGTGTPNTKYPEMSYQLAANTILVPALAEIHRYGDAKSPLRFLNEAMIQMLPMDGEEALYNAIDSVWDSPIDGVWPPSRWMRSRAVTYCCSGLGTWLSIDPDFLQGRLNPPRILLRKMERYEDRWEKLSTNLPLTYTDASGATTVVEGQGLDRALPALPFGAYRIEADTVDDDGEVVTAENWILLTPSGTRPTLAQQGIGIILIDQAGKPADPPNLSIGGATTLERVPGGLVVRPDPGTSDVIVRNGNRILAEITVAGPFSRTVVVPWQGPRPTFALGWSPYQPAQGEPLEIWARPDLTQFGRDASVDVEFTDLNGNTAASSQLTLDADGLLRGSLTVPFIGGRGHLILSGQYRDFDEVLELGAPLATAAPSAGPALETPYPNPSVSGFHWRVQGNGVEPVKLEVLDLRGRRVATQVLAPAAGSRELFWNGRASDGSRAAGVYFLRVTGDGLDETRRVVSLRSSR